MAAKDAPGVLQQSPTGQSVNSAPVVVGPAASVDQTVVLRRTGEDMSWGLTWQQAPFLRGVRIVEKLEEGSAAACWNRQQEQCGLPDRCILPFDRFVNVKLVGHVAVCEIQRMLIREEPVVQHG